jgi:hypothetical protein
MRYAVALSPHKIILYGNGLDFRKRCKTDGCIAREANILTAPPQPQRGVARGRSSPTADGNCRVGSLRAVGNQGLPNAVANLIGPVVRQGQRNVNTTKSRQMRNTARDITPEPRSARPRGNRHWFRLAGLHPICAETRRFTACMTVRRRSGLATPRFT